jgi:transcriptional regulator with XRE-family HTH domain
MDFAHRLKALRQEREMTLRKLGEKACISYSLINSIENGRLQPSEETVISIANALRYEGIDELLVLAGYDPRVDGNVERKEE